MPLVESTCCMNCHRLLQRITVLETKLLAGLPKQAEHTTERHHRQNTAGVSRESHYLIPSVEEQAKTDHTNRWHKQGARPKGTRDIRLSRVSLIAAVASSTPNTAMTSLVNTGILRRISVNTLKHLEDLKFSRSSVYHLQLGELTCFHGFLS